MGNSREAMMLAVQFADFGFGTVVGAVVAGSIAILLDQRRRKDEKKRLFLEEKRLMYRNIADAFDLLAEQVVLFGKWNAHFKKAEELDPEGLKLLETMGLALKGTLAETRRRQYEHGNDFSLLASREAKRAASAAMETIHKMLTCMGAEEPCDWTWMEVILKEELQNFRYFARQT
jgi:hypothetical protein